MAIAIALARESIEGIEKDNPALKMLGPVTDAFLESLRAKRAEKASGEDD